MDKTIWSEARIRSLIDNAIEERLDLEYKGAQALAKQDGAKKEITKDVSSMANSAGGTIIYGIKEYDDKEKRHEPERPDPVSRVAFPKEWLEQVINTIQPRIDGIVIYPIAWSSDPDHVVYVIEIPQSETAHQASDNRYYKRYNFQAVPMDHYEVIDILNRRQAPKINISLSITLAYYEDRLQNLIPPLYRVNSSIQAEYRLEISLENVGVVFGNYIVGQLWIPTLILHPSELKDTTIQRDEEGEWLNSTFQNTRRDLIKGDGLLAGEYGPARYEPLLPGLSREMTYYRLVDDFKEKSNDSFIRWKVYCDNAAPIEERVSINQIKVQDFRKDENEEESNHDDEYEDI